MNQSPKRYRSPPPNAAILLRRKPVGARPVVSWASTRQRGKSPRPRPRP